MPGLTSGTRIIWLNETPDSSAMPDSQGGGRARWWAQKVQDSHGSSPDSSLWLNLGNKICCQKISYYDNIFVICYIHHANY